MTTSQIPARARQQYAVWSKLGDAPLGEVEFLAAILRAMGRGPGSEADVSAMKFLLTSSGAVTVSSNEFGVTAYRRSATFPEHPPTGPGTAAWDQQNAEQAAREREDADRESAAVERNAPQLRQRQEWDQHFRALALKVFRAEMPEMLRQHDREVEQQRAQARSARSNPVKAGRGEATMRTPRVENTTARAVRGTPANDDPALIDSGREAELRNVASGIVRRRAQTRDIGAIRAKLTTSAAGHVRQAASQVRGREREHIPDADYEVFLRSVDRAVRDLDHEERLAELEHHAEVVSEPKVYCPDSPFSYFRDLAVATSARLAVPDMMLGAPRSSDVDMSPSAVQERLDKHVRDVQIAVAKGTPYGKKAEATIRESFRDENEQEHRQRTERELRLFSTGGGATATASTQAAAFVSPAWLTALWAPFRGVERAFADACHHEDLPPYGLQVYIPVFTGTDKVAKQAEGGSVTETTPTAGLEGSKLETLTGQVIITQQLLDRAVTGGGGGFDQLLAKQLRQQLDQEVDLYTLNEAISKGEAVSGETSYSTKGLYADLAKAREKLTDTAGTRLRPTHIYTTSDLYSYATRQVDATTERPILRPWFAPGFPISSGADDFDSGPKPAWSRFTGTVMAGGTLWFTDDNIPVVGTSVRTQIIVSAPDVAIVLCEGDPVVSVFTETKATELSVIVNLRNYVAAITRHAAGTAVISSSAYTTARV